MSHSDFEKDRNEVPEKAETAAEAPAADAAEARAANAAENAAENTAEDGAENAPETEAQPCGCAGKDGHGKGTCAHAEHEACHEREDGEKCCKKKKCGGKAHDAEKNDEAAKKLLAEMLADNESLKSELAGEKDKYLRLYAEYENFRKRTASEKSQIYSDSVAETVQKFLPVLDNLERAAGCSAETPDAKAVLSGVELVLRAFRETLEKLGIAEIPALGEPFDPSKHNAVMKEDAPDKEKNVVTEVFQKGYTLGGKVVRYAMVKVAN